MQMQEKRLHSREESAKISVKNGWVTCPKCGKMKLLRLPADGKVRAYIYCRHCRREQFLNIN